ncbi:pogo transposable [Pyrenophora seminiperda CCB06]|uniref:Pogo transposable n=1 Tax=Pyrenophora seminiperda CCB06 TaxID=1302712 RepID=A0A3M7LVS1_9PLEO|nr:pogo transposable [Pyrenophora seminiperda CCB06]
MKPELIIKSFQATSVWPMDADAILKRFNNHPQKQNEDLAIREHGDGDSWLQLRKFFDAAVANKAKVEAKRLSQSLHSLQVNNELLRDQNAGLQQELDAKGKTKAAKHTMDLQQREEYHGGAVLWSPRKIREARARDAVKRDEAEQQQLQKARDRDLKAAASLYRKQQQEAAKVARQKAAEERRELKKARAAELAAERALKKQQRDAATAEISLNGANTSKRKVSRSSAKNQTKRRRVVGAASRVDAAPEAPPPPTQKTRTRSIRPPKKLAE